MLLFVQQVLNVTNYRKHKYFVSLDFSVRFKSLNLGWQISPALAKLVAKQFETQIVLEVGLGFTDFEKPASKSQKTSIFNKNLFEAGFGVLKSNSP